MAKGRSHVTTPLTQAQIDYTTQRTNERGSTHTPVYTFVGAQTIAFGPGEGLNIVIKSVSDPGQGGGKRGPEGWNDGTVSDVFKQLVEDTLTVAERHLQ
jgi:hypothetical protein